MSLYMPQGKSPISNEQTVAPGVTITAEGQALVRDSSNTTAGVMPSTGQATDIFVGFAIAGTVGLPFPESYYNKVEDFVVPTSGQITLAETPVAGQVGLKNVTTGDSIPVTGGVTVTGKVVAGLTDAAGQTVRVTYKYALSVAQAVSLFGNVQPGGFVGALVDQIGVIRDANPIFTSEFDASKDWTKATQVKLAANGQVTDQSGTGNVIPGAVVIAAPGAGIPFLGLSIGTPGAPSA